MKEKIFAYAAFGFLTAVVLYVSFSFAGNPIYLEGDASPQSPIAIAAEVVSHDKSHDRVWHLYEVQPVDRPRGMAISGKPLSMGSVVLVLPSTLADYIVVEEFTWRKKARRICQNEM